jgi:glutamyl-tRNA reductase
MISDIVLVNFPKGMAPTLKDNSDVFQLNTCQRDLYLFREDRSPWPGSIINLGAEELKGVDAYQYLLEIICGLKSQLLGENEIVHQFKQAFHNYLSDKQRPRALVLLLEKLFKDAKEVRTQYLIGLGQKTYASIARKLIYSQVARPRVLILGSGQLATDLIHQFSKRSEIYLSARNHAKVADLLTKFDLDKVNWLDIQSYMKFDFVLNTIGTESTILTSEGFFRPWAKLSEDRLFIDLGSPSMLTTHEKLPLGDTYKCLDFIFQEGAIREKEKLDKVQKAKNFITDKAKNRQKWFESKLKRQELFVS